MYPDGQRKPCDITHEAALAFATEAAKAFGVSQSRTVPFEKERAKRDVSADETGKGKGKRGKRGDASTDEPETNG